jgi:hypothetical protein
MIAAWGGIKSWIPEPPFCMLERSCDQPWKALDYVTNIPRSAQIVLFGCRRTPNLHGQNVDWLAALFGPEYNAILLSDC